MHQESYQERKLRLCTRKIKYPLRSQAEEVARLDSERTKEDIRAYRCEFCESYHVGHYREVVNVKFEELNLVKLRVEENNNYVFTIPETIDAKDIELVLEYGKLVAHKVLGEPWLEKNDVKSQHWNALNVLNATYVHDIDMEQFNEVIAEHKANMIELKEVEPKAQKVAKAGSKTPLVGDLNSDLSVIKSLIEFSKHDSTMDANYFKGFAHVQLTRLLKLLTSA